MIDSLEQLKQIKATVGNFYEEVKSNSITELIVWIDCKIEYSERLRKQAQDFLKQKMKKR